jgi:hypothetical protein
MNVLDIARKAYQQIKAVGDERSLTSSTDALACSAPCEESEISEKSLLERQSETSTGYWIAKDADIDALENNPFTNPEAAAFYEALQRLIAEHRG